MANGGDVSEQTTGGRVWRRSDASLPPTWMVI
jgi:hypothetical protein